LIAGQAAPQQGDGTPGGRKILDWGEDGKPIYEDGTVGEAEDAAGQRDLQQASGDANKANWEERFGSHTDSRPRGPMSVGFDVTFPGSSHLYGIPEHASALALKTTDGSSGGYSEPFRLYNLDVFEYELDEPMALYGAIPFLVAHSVSGGVAKSSSVYWNNPTETFVDVAKTSAGASARWMSESGAWDLFLIPGPSTAKIFSRYTSITGTQALPPRFALGYHQCRWNYKDETDVLGVDAKFEEHNFPYDVLWLDIEHTDGKRYFTWDHHLFPDPASMINKLAARGRKMVTIIDPHIKRDSGYFVHKTATDNGYYIKNRHGSDFDGWCWPGSSSYLDFTSPKVRDWWASNFNTAVYKGSTDSLYTWNDMNEPSVFNGPEVSMDKDALSLEGVEHREWHNLYGFYQQMASAAGQVQRSGTRPFVLSRAFFAGSQRYGAIWTGDNFANWESLRIATPMLLSINLAGLSFAGADVGGFFKNPDVELLSRWYQAGSFQPFFRAHAHIETQRREPWLFGEEVLDRLRDIVRTRYTYLPLWYTLFYTAHSTGAPVMRPMWVEFPTDSSLLELDDQWMVGGDLVVKPITAPGSTSTSIVLPGAEPWYDVVTHEVYAPGKPSITAPLNKIPVFQRGGRIVARHMRPRRCSDLQVADPFTLVVALDSAGSAQGDLYLDDGNSFDYKTKSAFSLRQLTFSKGTLTSSTKAGAGFLGRGNTVERVVILGVKAAPASIVAKTSGGVTRDLTFVYESSLARLTIRKPDVVAAEDWTITIA